jgi:hypothetical protein
VTREQYVQAFHDGASAMQGRIAAILMMKGHIELAQHVLGMDTPTARPPERIELRSTLPEQEPKP